MTEDYKALIARAVFDEQAFVRLTMRGIVRGPAAPWRQIVVRPVELRAGRHLQFSYFDAKKDVSKNYAGAEAAARLDEALGIGYSSLVLQTRDEDIQVQITKKGKALIHRHRRAPEQAAAPDLAHNRAKALPLPPGQPDAFLHAIGIVNEHGQVRPAMQGKLAQINEFIKLADAGGELGRFEHSPINVLDCGCGAAYLTFALYHYLNEIRGIPAQLVGVDTNAELIARCADQAAGLSYTGLCFTHTPIIEFSPEHAPDLVVALHACDTATDEAIAQGIRHGARMLVVAPCCHHELNDRFDNELFRPVLRHGILRQRLGDMLTDTFRALILRIMGYRAEVIEFVAAEHTAKNLMIRAVRAAPPGDPQFAAEYRALKQLWGVTPYLEGLLGEQLTRLLGDSAA